MATYHIPDDFANLQAAFAGMVGGDTLIIRDGTYTGAVNAIGGTNYPPYGSVGDYTIIKAENNGGAIFDGELTNAMCYMNTVTSDDLYWQFEGIHWVNSGVQFVNNNYVKFLKCGSSDVADDNTPNFLAGRDCSHFLFENCYAYGNGRYKFEAYQSDYMIFRQCVGRLDRVNIANPTAIFSIYSCNYVEVQNCIAIDSDQSTYYSPNEFSGPFTVPSTDASASNINFTQCIGLNNKLGGLKVTEDTTLINYDNCSFWDNETGSTGDIMHVMKGNSTTITNCNFGDELHDYRWVDADNVLNIHDIHNNIIYNVSDGQIFTWFNANGEDYNCLYGNTGTVHVACGTPIGANDISTNPIWHTTTNTDGALKYITQTESGNSLATAGESSDQIGANVLTLIGTLGTLWGETGYATDTGTSMWPFPNEDLIKTKMAAYSYDGGGLTGTRGFCINTPNPRTDTGYMTLTSYIWEYLGNEMPSDIYEGLVGITLHPQASCPLNEAVVVTFGFPIAQDTLTDSTLIRVMDDGTEIAAYVNTLLTWKNITDGSSSSYIRSVSIQIEHTFTDLNPVNLKVEIGTSISETKTLSTPTANWVLVEDDKFVSTDEVYEPIVYITLPANYMGDCAIKTKTVPFETYSDFDYYDDAILNEDPSVNSGQNFFKTMVNDEEDVSTDNDMDYTTAYELWLFDRPQTMFNFYVRSGNVEHLKWAHRNAYFYARHIKDSGYFDVKTTDDLKYCWPEGLVSDLILMGDNYSVTNVTDLSTNTLTDTIENMVLATSTFDHVYNDSYYLDGSHSASLWTERHYTVKWLNYICAFEVTGTTSYATNAVTMMDDLVTHQNATITYSGNTAPSDGGLMHLFSNHEGFYSTARPYWCFSPWMTTLLVDTMQRYMLHADDNTRVIAAAKKFGDAVINVGAYSTTMPGATTDKLEENGLWPQYWYPASRYNTRYLVASEQPSPHPLAYTTDSNGEHTLDVSKTLAFAYYCCTLDSSDGSTYLSRFNDMVTETSPYSAKYALAYFIRPAAHDTSQTIYRLGPGDARKGNWWFRTTSDMDYLIAYEAAIIEYIVILKNCTMVSCTI